MKLGFLGINALLMFFEKLFKKQRKFTPDVKHYNLNNNIRRKSGSTQARDVFKMKANKRHKHNKMVRIQKQKARKAA